MGKENQREKRTAVGIAMAMCFLATVTVSGALYANRAYAKETLQGITKVVSSVTEKDEEGNFKNPFVILEIIPDFVEHNFTVQDKDNNSVDVSLDVNIGSVGYYVKGQEPTTKNLQQALEQKDSNEENYLYNDSEVRKNIAAEILKRDNSRTLRFLVSDTDTNAVFKEDNPKGYKELRLGEIMSYSHSFGGQTAESFTEATPERMERLVKDGTFIALPRNYAGTRDENDNVTEEPYIDVAKGVMNKVSDGERGNYTRTYEPQLKEDGTLDTANDEAYKFLMNNSNDVFEKLVDNTGSPIYKGEFDPYFVDGGDTPTHRVVFGPYVSIRKASNGYKVTKAEAVSLPDPNVKPGTPLYQYIEDENYYVPAGYYDGAGGITDLLSGASLYEEEEEETLSPAGMGTSGGAAAPEPSEGQTGTGGAEGAGEQAETGGAEGSGEQTEAGGAEGAGEQAETGETEGSGEQTGTGGAEGSGEQTGTGGTEPAGEPILSGSARAGLPANTSHVLGEYRPSEESEPAQESGTTGENTAGGNTTGENTTGGETTGANTTGEGASEPGGTTGSGEGSGETTGYEPEPAAYGLGGSETYYVLHFEYVPVSGGETLYQVYLYDTASTFTEYAVNTSAAGAIVPNVNGEGSIAIKADKLSQIEDRLIYDYTPQRGVYHWTGEAWLPDGRDMPFYRIRGAQIYYSTGLLNRDFFKKLVFDREDDECDGLPIEVWTIPASQVTVDQIGRSNMLVLQRGEPAYGCADGKDTEAYPLNHGGANDIADDVLAKIISRVKDGYPVVSDYGLFADGGQELDGSKSNVYNLTRTLILNDGGTPAEEGYDSAKGTYNNVMKNVYNVSYGSGSNEGICNDHFSAKINDETGFSEVVIDIQNENVYRVASGQSKLTNSILSQATILRYIIAYAAEPEYAQKGSLHILELAPCASYTLTLEPSGDENQYKTLYVIEETNEAGAIVKKRDKGIEFKSGDVTLTQMTTAEFIGHVDDINAYYDMVYIGSRTNAYKLENGSIARMNHNWDGTKTDYNDDNMDGLIYSNIGDKYTTFGINFKNETGDETMRFSGNDITEEKKKALQEFIGAGFPVVVSDELVNVEAESTDDGVRPLLSVNRDTVDQNSWMYAFLNDNRERENFFRLSEISGSLLNMYLNVGRPTITLVPGSKTEKATNATQELSADSNGNYRAQFEFRIDNVGIGSGDETYDFELYIDINADGKFSRTTEEITQISLEDDAGNAIATDGQGRYLMRSGGTYYATYILSPSFRGVLPWKIRVIQNDDSHLRRADAIGYYEVKDKDNPEKVSVLQICNVTWKTVLEDPDTGEALSEKDDFDKINKILLGWDDTERGDTGHNWNMEKTMSDTKTEFSKLINNRSAVPFEVTIKSIPYDWLTWQHRVYLEKKLGEANVPNDLNQNEKYDVDEYLAFFRNFDMIVIGFGDAFFDPYDEILEALLYYSEEGRSILFTHDNTSPYTYGDQHGSHFNRFLRGIFAMDRYNVTGYRKAEEGDAFSVEQAYAPKSSPASIVVEQEAMTYPNLLRQKANGSELSYLGGMPDAKSKNNGTSDEGYDRNTYSNFGYWVTDEVESVNRGQITMYPYKLDEKFKVAITHSQYWQLDFTRDEDRDGESDLVVWYTLSGTDVYNMSPRDVRNNYYIYNMGNITYSGVGHRDVMQAVQSEDGSWSESINEMKLFINTLIAAYQSGLHDPEIRIVENYNPQSRDVNSVYLSYDEQFKSITAVTNPDMGISAGVIDATEDIYFVVNSTSLVRTDTMRTHTLSADLYVEVPTADGAELLALKGGNAYGRHVTIQSLHRQAADGSEVEVLPDAVGVYNVESGVVYKATVPVSEFTYYSNGTTVFDDSDTEIPDDGSVNARNARRIFVVATESINNLRSGAKTETRAMDSVKALRLRVFDMD